MKDERKFFEMIDKIFEKIDAMAEKLISMESSQEGFWSRDWPSIMTKINDNSTRVATIELDLAKLKTKIAISGIIVFFILTSAVTLSTAYLATKSNEKEKIIINLIEELKAKKGN